MCQPSAPHFFLLAGSRTGEKDVIKAKGVDGCGFNCSRLPGHPASQVEKGRSWTSRIVEKREKRVSRIANRMMF